MLIILDLAAHTNIRFFNDSNKTVVGKCTTSCAPKHFSHQMLKRKYSIRSKLAKVISDTCTFTTDLKASMRLLPFVAPVLQTTVCLAQSVNE